MGHGRVGWPKMRVRAVVVTELRRGLAAVHGWRARRGAARSKGSGRYLATSLASPTRRKARKHLFQIGWRRRRVSAGEEEERHEIESTDG